EINRATPRTQSALLEAMGEGQVTVEGVTYRLPEPFFVIATENPVETYGTFPLPEAELDRFLLSLRLGYPSIEQEVAILDLEEHETPVVGPALEADGVLELQRLVRQVRVSRPIKEYVVRLVTATRTHPDVLLGVSPRGGVAIQRAAQAAAALAGRPFVTPDDVKRVAEPVMAHRLLLKTSLDGAATELVGALLNEVSVPL
ncbi:MAG: MoxR family ATPase, partial [Chloroflexi bacterium]|nr:MoxR family ATPase [Chloroflexota bacterium]